MSTFRFIHCSDLHIDSPMKGFSQVNEAWALRLRRATLQAFENIVRLAVAEEVDAVVIAGDIFDGADKSLPAQLKFHRALTTLSEAGIPVFMAHGNHDPLDTWLETLKWPSGVHVFSGREVEAVPVVRDGRTLAHIHGISFPRKVVDENLARKFSRQQQGGFAIGVLHSNVGGDPNHAVYAPCSVDDLVAAGMDYWALGHIHARRVIREEAPAIVYCGNSQGRHVNESGAKGCCRVTLSDNAAPEIQFVATDVFRFAEATVDLSACESLHHVSEALEQRGRELLQEADGRDLFVRLTLTGRTAMHGELAKPGGLAGLRELLAEDFENGTPALWAELRLQTRGLWDEEELRQGSDFIADVIRQYDGMTGPDDLSAAREWLEPLYGKWGGQKWLEVLSDEEVRELLLAARDLTLDALMDDNP